MPFLKTKTKVPKKKQFGKSRIIQNWFNLDIQQKKTIFEQLYELPYMKKTIYLKSISELLIDTCTDDIRAKVSCKVIDYEGITARFSSSVYLNAFIGILVLSGTGTICINYKSYIINANVMLLLSSSHLFSFNDCSLDFKCLCIFVSKDFVDDMDSTDMIYKRIKYGVRLYNTPLLKLSSTDASLLLERVSSVERAIGNSEHFYHKEMILNCLFAFYLDLSNIIEHHTDDYGEGNLTRYESITKSFIELLVTNYRKEHKIEFYSSRLNISPHYLTLIVKHIAGQTVSDFIFEMLFSEARSLLIHSKLSIQEITISLNFSDQSAFGKFFKRKAGMSPIDYRKKRN